MLLLTMLLACGDKEPTDSAVVECTGDDGATMYANECASCHGEAGEGGGVGPAIAGSNEAVEAMIEGEGAMQSYVGVLCDEDMQLIADFVQNDL